MASLLRVVRYDIRCIMPIYISFFFVSERLCTRLSWNKDPEVYHRLASSEALFTIRGLPWEVCLQALNPRRVAATFTNIALEEAQDLHQHQHKRPSAQSLSSLSWHCCITRLVTGLQKNTWRFVRGQKTL